MIDPKVVLVALAVWGGVWIGGQVVKGAKKIAHGAHTVACAIRMPSVHCDKKPETK